MLLTSISIQNFQQYDKPFELKGLSAGINVIYGNNEAGKSTLLRALRAILFDRFNGKGAEDFVGYNGGCPEVKIQFDLGGNSYTLEKIFSKKKEGRAILTNEQGIKWTGTEAEIHLAELLKFDTIERGLTKSEQQGIYGVLWVEQGSAWQQVSVSNNLKASQAIQSVLNHELTDMLSQGKGESLLKRFSDELNEYQTEKTGKPKGVFKEILDSKEAAKQKLENLQDELSNYQKRVDQLSGYQRDLATLVDHQVEEKDKEQLETAQKHLRHAEEINEQHKKTKTDVELIELKHESAQKALKERLDLIENLQIETANEKSAQTKIKELETEVEQFEKNFKISTESLSKAKDCHERSQLTLKKARSYQKLTEVQKNIKHIEEQLNKAQTLNDEIKQKQHSLSEILIGSSTLADLRKLKEQVNSLQAKFDAVATRIKYSINEDSVKLNDDIIAGEGEVFISDKSIITFGSNKICIIPGGEELSAVQTKLDNAKKLLLNQFEQHHIVSLSEAEELFDKKKTLSSEIDSLQAHVQLISPNGIESLKQQLTDHQTEENILVKQLGDSDQISIDEAEALENSASKELTKCSDNERQVHDQLVKKQEALKHAKIALSSTKENLVLLIKKIEKTRNDNTDEQLKNIEKKIAHEKQMLREKLSELENTLLSLDYVGAASEVERRQQVLDNTKKRMADLKQTIRDLTIELQTSGHRGLAEEKEQAEQELKELCNEVQRLEMHVGSLNLLCQLIRENIQSAKELLVKPLTEAMTPYLKILFPNSEPIIDEEFCLQHILRDGIREPFENLSIGTREQLAILLRLAYADLLAEKGASVPVILDDALVNSDDIRREKMKQILHRASKKHQIILLTCHGNDYRDCGGKFLSI
ncbi:AAA family ATPase [Legionella pneumophila]|uniref:AAA family ATPase n=1 Tax=Legionella pneumophila TaxID=446 RepID=UPI00077082A3|nr:AAA family ATPase [Legionella pneumophila]CZO83502.1 chromosome segregation protein [Legionella pneumophila]